MKNYQKLVWKLIDRNISESEFNDLQIKLLSDVKLRDYYQQCLETESTLANRHHSPFLRFSDEKKDSKSKITSFTTFIGGVAAAAVLFFAFFHSPTQSSARLVSAENPDWRGVAVKTGEEMPNTMLHLQNGAVEIDFPSDTKVVIEAPAYFQITSDSSIRFAKGMLTATHGGQPGTFQVNTPVGSITDLGTQFGVWVDHSLEEATVITQVFEGNIKFEGNQKQECRFLNEGENAIIRGSNTENAVKIIANHPYAQLHPRPTLKTTENKRPDLLPTSKGFDFENQNEEAEENIDAVDLMLQGNLSAQINYSMVKGIALAIDEKVQILQNAKDQYTPHDEVPFAEAAMPQIEAMGRSIVDSYVKFPKIRYWEACQTAEIIWDKKSNLNGQISHSIPHPKKLDQPKDGNRLLKNLEKIREWVTEVHLIHGEKGMGWASQFGCPEDGKSIFDKRNKNLLAITYAIDSIKSNID
tara:strand:- start:141 stop:1547 length:1407 start_codon:yes stop_codon:yes gene_type:complete